MQGALLLSEVLRERDAQVEYKKRKAILQQHVNEKFLRRQEEVSRNSQVTVGTFTSISYPHLHQERERAILVDMKAAEERVKAKDGVASFQTSQ